jgi:electron transfer flavoprotein beta subunit
MKIVVCVKQIRMTYARTGMDPETFYLNPEDIICRVNPYDEAALEIGLRVKDIRNDVSVSILTLGTLIAERELRRCLAMGADDLCHIDVDDKFDSWNKSILLAGAIKDLKADLVICGKESLDKRDGQIPAFIAHHIKVPLIASILDMKFGNEGAIVTRNAGKGIREKIECPLPALFSVDLGFCEPRIPTYVSKQKAMTAVIHKMEYSDEIPSNRVASLGTFPPRPRPKRVITPDSRLAAFDRIDQLLAGSLVEKKGTKLAGSPESQVEGITDFLREHGYLRYEK